MSDETRSKGGRGLGGKKEGAVEVRDASDVEVKKPAQADGDDKPWVRLSINLAKDVAAALRELVERRGTSATEEVRRAISIYKFIFDEIDKGNRVVVERGDERLEIKFF